MMADKDQVKGAAKTAAGAVKEGFGKITGDEKLKAEGRADTVGGNVQKTAGDVKAEIKH